jgi:CHAT domain-containing protein
VQQLNEVGTDRQKLSTIQHDLYTQLINPFLSFIEKKKQLMIVPHNELAYLPFELLLNNSEHYLLEDLSITYDYSLAVLHSPSSSESNDLLVAFAPFAGQGKNSGAFSPIPASRTEVSELDGKIFFDSAATKQQFLSVSSQMGIAHLATHAAANDSIPLESFIAFYPSGHDTSFKLFEPEIYSLDLRASKLVILSACETGAGKLVHGEGLLSLSRAFSYAGCPSIITSLWKADDESTAYICKRLHHYLSKGLAKDVALQRAKLDYLKDENISQRLKLARFWANLVLVGDNSPVYPYSALSFLLLSLIILLLVIILLFIAWRYKKKKARAAGLVP